MIYGCIGKYITNKMTYYIFCASNESIPGILCISYSYQGQGRLKYALDFLNRKTPMFSLFRMREKGRMIPYQKYRQLPTPYNFVFIKKWEGELVGSFDDSYIWESCSNEWETIIREFKLSKLNIVDNNKKNFVGYGGNFYKNSIEEVKVLFDHIEGDYVDYLIEDALIRTEECKKSVNDRIMKETEDKINKETEDRINKETEDRINKETEDRIINSYFKTLEDTLEKKKGELERLDAILSERKAEIAKLNK